MNLIPTLCVDNFYDNPSEVREFALSLEYGNIIGNYPGIRTDTLDKIDSNFYDSFCKKLFSLFYSEDTSEWKVETTFHKIYPYDDEELNVGEIHKDDIKDIDFAGLIYLNINPLTGSGTSFYSLKKDEEITAEDLRTMDIFKHELYRGVHDRWHDPFIFRKILRENNSKFERILEIKNSYNRLITYPSNVWHGATNLQMNDEFRLTQPFFIKGCKSTLFLRS